jgi:predicted nicotinamide N-methyase
MPQSHADRRRRQLLARIHRRQYQTITEPVTVAGRTFEFTRIADPNRVLDQVAEAEDLRDKLEGKRRDGEELHLPYWAELWDSSLAMIEILAETGSGFGVQGSGNAGTEKGTGAFSSLNPEPRTLNPLSVLDLGCGMGLVGAVAAALGASVLFADLEPDALLFARLNAIDHEDRIRTRQLNWKTARLAERFDLICGADILYEKTNWPHLEPFWRGHLKPGGIVLLGEPGRQTGDLFLDWIKPHPWRIEQLKKAVPTRTTPIRLFQMTKDK